MCICRSDSTCSSSSSSQLLAAMASTNVTSLSLLSPLLLVDNPRLLTLGTSCGVWCTHTLFATRITVCCSPLEPFSRSPLLLIWDSSAACRLAAHLACAGVRPGQAHRPDDDRARSADHTRGDRNTRRVTRVHRDACCSHDFDHCRSSQHHGSAIAVTTSPGGRRCRSRLRRCPNSSAFGRTQAEDAFFIIRPAHVQSVRR